MLHEPYEIELNYTKESIDNILPFWKFDLSGTKRLGDISIGSAVYSRVIEDFATKPKVSVRIRCGKFEYSLAFSNDQWLQEVFLKAGRAEDIYLDPQITALVLEANIIRGIEELEKNLRQSIELIAINKDAEIESSELPKMSWDITIKDTKSGILTEPDTKMSLQAMDESSHQFLIEQINKVLSANKKDEISIDKISLPVSLVADVADITSEHIKSLQPGDGLIIDAQWTKNADFRITSHGQNLASLKDTDGKMVIERLHFAPLEKNQSSRKSERGTVRKSRRNTTNESK